MFGDGFYYLQLEYTNKGVEYPYNLKGLRKVPTVEEIAWNVIDSNESKRRQ